MPVRKSSDRASRRSRRTEGLRTWIEVDSRAVRRNIRTFKNLIGPKVKLWAVVKSNAYGHGLTAFSKLADRLGVHGFCVDSLVEGLRLRGEGIKKPILVLGPTLPALLPKAARAGITVSVSSAPALLEILKAKERPSFHIKIDTGMHRQGFYLEELPRIVPRLSRARKDFSGIFTHFASAKDLNYPTYTEEQFKKFNIAAQKLRKDGFDTPEFPLIKHCAATGGTLVNKKYHCDAVRVGIGLYGLYPSKELEMQLPKLRLHPALSWRTVVAEVKELRSGDYVGYDLSERVAEPAKMAVLPIGYWHGFPRSFSNSGNVLVNGRPAKVLGKVSMDLVAIDVTGIKCRPGDTATVIGKSEDREFKAHDVAQQSGTIHYEFITRLNPLIERIIT